jgi:hypothetical protein
VNAHPASRAPLPPARPFPRDLRADATRWCLTALLLTNAMVPWYALRLLPVVTVGTAKVNLLDVLAACCVLLALPTLVRGVLDGPRELLWVCAFLGYLVIPLAAGLRDHEATFFAVREARALAFYALALVFATGGYGPGEFRGFTIAYVVGTVIAGIAVVAHVHWYTPLPGFPAMVVPPSQWGAFTYYQVRYLEWTVPLVAFTLSLAGLLGASTSPRIGWAFAALIVGWYILASAERFTQMLASAVTVAVILLWARRTTPRRGAALAGVILACAAVLGLGAVAGPAPVRDLTAATFHRWSEWASDRSLAFRVEELRGGLARWTGHPVFGIGLGGLVIHNDPANQHLPWRYVSSGYAFLLIKTGVIGLAVYLGMVAAVLRRGWRSLRAARTPEDADIVLVGILGLGLLLALNTLYTAVDTPEGVIAFSLFSGMLLSRGAHRAAAR